MYLQDEKGNVSVNLPVSGVNVSLRPPKGKDLAAIEKASRRDDVSNVEIMAETIAALSSPPLSANEVLDMDAEDVMCLGEALNSFRVLRRS